MLVGIGEKKVVTNFYAAIKKFPAAPDLQIVKNDEVYSNSEAVARKFFTPMR